MRRGIGLTGKLAIFLGFLLVNLLTRQPVTPLAFNEVANQCRYVMAHNSRFVIVGWYRHAWQRAHQVVECVKVVKLSLLVRLF